MAAPLLFRRQILRGDGHEASNTLDRAGCRGLCAYRRAGRGPGSRTAARRTAGVATLERRHRGLGRAPRERRRFEFIGCVFERGDRIELERILRIEFGRLVVPMGGFAGPRTGTCSPRSCRTLRAGAAPPARRIVGRNLRARRAARRIRRERIDERDSRFGQSACPGTEPRRSDL